MKKILLAILCVFSLSNLSALDLTKEQNMQKVYIIHGYDAHPQKHWFVWLKNELEKDKNVSVEILILPNPSNPTLESWLEILNKEIGKANGDTFIIGHSLGCITTLRYLEGLDSKKVGGVMLVSGFDKPLSILPDLNPFVAKPLDYKKLTKMLEKKVVISAKDDEIVPTELSKELAKNLGAEFVQTDTGGHFMESDGFTTFPLALETMQKMLGK